MKWTVNNKNGKKVSGKPEVPRKNPDVLDKSVSFKYSKREIFPTK